MTNSPKVGEEEWSVAKGADQHLQRGKGAAHNTQSEIAAQIGFRVHMDKMVAKSGKASDETLNRLSPMRVARLSNTPKRMKKKIPIALIVLAVVVIIVTIVVMIQATS